MEIIFNLNNIKNELNLKIKFFNLLVLFFTVLVALGFCRITFVFICLFFFKIREFLEGR